MSDYIGLVASVFAFYIVAELVTRRFPLRTSARNTWLDIAAFTQASFLVGPLIVYGTAALERWLLPGHANAWVNAAWYWQLAAFLVFDDMVQYWWHRLTHAVPFLWGLHKFHHTPEYMGVRIIWRNGFFYDLILPNLWFAGVLVYLGFGETYFWYYLVKLLVTMGAHSSLRWDSFLYRHKALHPLAWVVERIISTPATHFAHHALREDDGVGHYNGNFGNLLFFWDVLFGTARITRQYPPAFGVQSDAKAPDPWHVLIFYPIFKGKS